MMRTMRTIPILVDTTHNAGDTNYANNAHVAN